MPQTPLHHSLPESRLIPHGAKTHDPKDVFRANQPFPGNERTLHSLPSPDSARAPPPARPGPAGAAFHAQNPFPLIFNFHFRFLVPLFPVLPHTPPRCRGGCGAFPRPCPGTAAPSLGQTDPGSRKAAFLPSLPSRRPAPDPPSHPRASPAVAAAAPRSVPAPGPQIPAHPSRRAHGSSGPAQLTDGPPALPALPGPASASSSSFSSSAGISQPGAFPLPGPFPSHFLGSPLERQGRVGGAAPRGKSLRVDEAGKGL